MISGSTVIVAYEPALAPLHRVPGLTQTVPSIFYLTKSMKLCKI
jgi:hypothetical protein